MSAYSGWLEGQREMEVKKNSRKTRQWLTLEAWVRELGWTAGAEIGVARGWTTFHLLDAFPGLRMTMVDQWLDVPDTGVPGYDSYRRMRPEWCARMVKSRAAGYGDRCWILHMDSVSAAGYVEDGSLSFAFIDADHTEAGVTRDITAWAPKVKPDGWITGHDWHRPEVRRVLDRLLPGWEQHDNHCWRIPRAATGL